MIGYLLLSAFGVTFIITDSLIFKPIRNFFSYISPNFLGEGITCPLCVGFWIGVAYRYFTTPVIEVEYLLVSYIMNAALFSIVSFILYKIQDNIFFDKKQFLSSVLSDVEVTED
jgi:hypothetical protein